MPNTEKQDIEEVVVEEPLAAPPEPNWPGVPAVVTPEIYKWHEENDPHFLDKKEILDAKLGEYLEAGKPKETAVALATAMGADTEEAEGARFERPPQEQGAQTGQAQHQAAQPAADKGGTK